jgi:pantoate kinase
MALSVVNAPLAVAKAFSPGHVTGFIHRPAETNASHLHLGSLGAGFSIDHGITTTVEVHQSSTLDYTIWLNGQRGQDVEVSRWVVEEYLKLINGPDCHIDVKHEISIPIGFGLGSSGAAALSLSYALNEALGIGLSKRQAAQIAHHAEIACKTGLGTVIAEFAGGFEMRTSIGAPGIGIVEKMELKDHKAIILCISPISTKSFLNNRIDLVNELGEKMLKKLKLSRDVNDFLKMSYDFAGALELTEGSCKVPIQGLKSNGFNCGVALFGETVFTIVPTTKIREVKDCLKGLKGNLTVCNIANTGARVL